MCQNVFRYSEINKDLLYGLSSLLISYKVGTNGREQAYRNFITQYVNGNVEELIQFMNRELLGSMIMQYVAIKYLLKCLWKRESNIKFYFNIVFNIKSLIGSYLSSNIRR